MSVSLIASDAQARDVVDRLAVEFREGARERDQQRVLPAKEIEQLTSAGFFGITVPRAHGGAEVSAATVVHCFRVLAAADPSIAQIPQNHFCWLPLFSNGTPEQARFFHARILAGDRIGNAHSEDTRKRAFDYEHRLERVEGGWRMTGRKFYSTGAIFAQWIPFIGDDEAGRPHMFFAHAESPGLKVVNDWSGMGQRTTASGTTLFDQVHVPDAHVLPFASEGPANQSRRLLASLIHAAIDQGIAEEVLDDARRYILHENRPWIDNPHDEHAREPFVVQEFGSYAVQVRTAALSLRNAAERVDEAWAAPSDRSVLEARLAIADARLNCGDAATTLADRFFTLTGARATLEARGLDRHWRNARTHSLHDPLRWKLYHLGNYHLNGVVPGPRTYI
ncbi:SfnB family sulfur acquisition oxidoreductase [Variovorax sp. Sphag1AA]|uniref:SfnB family sulfur acquisition oxidoreductase n=1 Tax=Variovorax sp. Sphag1AA TaxID=2587027 RepID=UPI00161AEE9D|nr:SfnB family sulfur acquisition oxidoreductase [Variovorax sp. Sphag1AA]MBB3181442.1 SfnB family sulfur acquisition oxidoreductase [Variovorax sp. Sphag1AA]